MAEEGIELDRAVEARGLTVEDKHAPFVFSNPDKQRWIFAVVFVAICAALISSLITGLVTYSLTAKHYESQIDKSKCPATNSTGLSPNATRSQETSRFVAELNGSVHIRCIDTSDRDCISAVAYALGLPKHFLSQDPDGAVQVSGTLLTSDVLLRLVLPPTDTSP